MKINTRELKGSALDWAVLKSLIPRATALKPTIFNSHYVEGGLHYSTDHAVAGEIIDAEEISVWLTYDGLASKGRWSAAMPHWFDDDPVAVPEYEAFYGDTRLVAAMRCLVHSRLGDVVDVPEGLK